MPLSGMVVVRDELHEIDADNVVAFLQAQGIEAMANSDDAGGLVPSLQESRGCQVLVPESQAGRARELLAELPPPGDAGESGGGGAAGGA